MRSWAISLALLLASGGCARVLGIDFDAYREPGATGQASPQLECVPREISRCLCELDEGVRSCDDAGHLGPCVCGGGAPDASGAVGGCGNSALEDGEACDDGNGQDGDGCSSACVPDGRPPEVEQCPGQDVFVWAGRPVAMQLVGVTRAADVQPDAGGCDGSAQPDRVLALTTNASGQLQIKVSASVPTIVSVRTTCAVAASSASCELASTSQPTTQTVDVSVGQPIFLTLLPTNVSPTATFAIEVTHL